MLGQLQARLMGFEIGSPEPPRAENDKLGEFVDRAVLQHRVVDLQGDTIERRETLDPRIGKGFLGPEPAPGIAQATLRVIKKIRLGMTIFSLPEDPIGLSPSPH